MGQGPKDYKPPQSAEELLERYAAGERDFQKANLMQADLTGADLTGCDLSLAELSELWAPNANLSQVCLIGTNLAGANLEETNISKAKLISADLVNADLRSTDLRSSDFNEADLRYAYLNKADLRQAKLIGAVLIGKDLTASVADVNFHGAIFGRTSLSNLDLASTTGLDAVVHYGPSYLSTSTLARSQGRIPGSFLRGCGLSEWEVKAARLYDPVLSPSAIAELQQQIFNHRAGDPIQISPIFISYSHSDAAFAAALAKAFDANGIRYWRDKKDMMAGRIETQLERAISIHGIVLLIFSKDSVESDWVEWEVSRARAKEKETGHDVLCPIALDDSWKTCHWPGPLRRQIEDYNVVDFSDWRDESAFARAFQEKLLHGLKLFYRNPKE